jgi:hypothetical protein
MLDLQAVRAAYLRSGDKVALPPHAEHTGKSKLYLSDLGGCHKRALLRATEAKKKWVSDRVQDNLQMKFAVGNYVHDLTYYALEWAGLLVECESRVEGLPEPFGGRLDCIYYDHTADKLVLWDGKTVRSNQLKDYRDQLPKPENVLQITAYGVYLPGSFDLYCLEYMDQAGTNDPEPCFFTTGDHDEAVRAEMDSLLAAYNALPDLPDVLPPVVKEHYSQPRKRKDETEEQFAARRSSRALNRLGLARDWRCGWCDYAGESCTPRGPEEEIDLATLNTKSLKWEYSAEGMKQQEWVEAQIARRT